MDFTFKRSCFSKEQLCNHKSFFFSASVFFPSAFYFIEAAARVLIHSFIHPKRSSELRKGDPFFQAITNYFPEVQTPSHSVFRDCEKETWQSRRIHFCLINPIPYFRY